MKHISKITKRLMRDLALQRIGSRVQIIDGESESGAHTDRSQILDQMRDQKDGRGGSGQLSQQETVPSAHSLKFRG